MYDLPIHLEALLKTWRENKKAKYFRSKFCLFLLTKGQLKHLHRNNSQFLLRSGNTHHGVAGIRGNPKICFCPGQNTERGMTIGWAKKTGRERNMGERRVGGKGIQEWKNCFNVKEKEEGVE
jgi:hypothetical protein